MGNRDRGIEPARKEQPLLGRTNRSSRSDPDQGRQPRPHRRPSIVALPPRKLIVTEHRVEVKVCPNSGREVAAPFPADVIAPAQYSPCFNARLVCLRVQQLIPLERIAQMAHDFFGATVSQAIIHNAVSPAYRALDAFETTVAGLLSRASVAHADETGLRVAGQLHWLHVAGTKLLTWHGVSRRRGRDAVKHFALLTKFSGRLVHDCLSAYFQLNCLHGLRNARLLRKLVFLFEVQRRPWAKSMFRLLIECTSAGKNNRDVFQEIVAAFMGNPFIPTFAE